MPRYFEDEEELQTEEHPPDTEITLGWGKIAGLVSALLVICGLCFWLGYSVGHRRPAPVATATQTAAPDQEPLEGNSSVPKPDASEQVAVPPAQDNAAQPATAQGVQSPATASQNVSGATAPVPQPGSQSAPLSGTSAAQVQPALGNSVPETGQAGATPGVRPALPSTETLMVQVAAVKHPEDANVLTDALQKRGYPVSQRRDPIDGLIHVRVGPFSSVDEANSWRMKLLNDGYNAIVQP